MAIMGFWKRNLSQDDSMGMSHLGVRYLNLSWSISTADAYFYSMVVQAAYYLVKSCTIDSSELSLEHHCS